MWVSSEARLSAEGGKRGVQGRPWSVARRRAPLGWVRHFRGHFPTMPLSPPSGLMQMQQGLVGAQHGWTWPPSCNTCLHLLPLSQGGWALWLSAFVSWRLPHLNARQPDIQATHCSEKIHYRKMPVTALTLLWMKLMRKQLEGETSALFSNRCS